MPAATHAFLDSNASTSPTPEVIDAVVKWMGRPDGSESTAAGETLLRRFRRSFADSCDFNPKNFTIVFTSGGSEGNCHIVTSSVRAYLAVKKTLPHLVIGGAEHASTRECCFRLRSEGLAQITVVPVRTAGPGLGTVDPEELKAALRPNTCLISIIAADGETGAINDLKALGAIARAAKIPLHTDASHLYGRAAIRPAAVGLSAFSGSFRRIHGPPGVGFLVIHNDFLRGYSLGPLVAGGGRALRGGAENLPGLAGAFAAHRATFADRSAKGARMRRLREGLMAVFGRHFCTTTLGAFCEARPRIPDGDALTPRSSRVRGAPREKGAVDLAQRIRSEISKERPVLVWLVPGREVSRLPNTLLFSTLLQTDAGALSGALLAKALGLKNVHVGSVLGHLDTLDIPPELRAGALRISFSDHTTPEEVAYFISTFRSLVSSPDVRGQPKNDSL